MITDYLKQGKENAVSLECLARDFRYEQTKSKRRDQPHQHGRRGDHLCRSGRSRILYSSRSGRSKSIQSV